ncbi:AFG1-like ATPase-domain-containing protein [Entophlyctis helioformis]|nr:AFG1-like ATPase-domain-containing protein [Entophlyctis helioformis]
MSTAPSPPPPSTQLAQVGPLPEYYRRIALKEIEPDQDQMRAAVALQKLCEELLHYRPPVWDAPLVPAPSLTPSDRMPDANSDLDRLAASLTTPSTTSRSLVRVPGSDDFEAYGPRTLLMDMFFDSVPTPHKTRIHFHAFMQSLYAKLHSWHSLAPSSPARSEYVMDTVARDLLRSSWLICFDEFQITDIATASLLKPLFSALFRHGAVLVATSNRVPDDLYTGGFARKNNVQLINLLTERCTVVHLRSEHDYRAQMLADTRFEGPGAVARSYYKLDSPENAKAFVERVGKLFYGKQVYSETVKIHGRKQTIHKAADGIALFTFEELCGSSNQPWGPAEYLQLCASFHTIVVQSVPQMGLFERNEARRFITFIDAAYENKTKLVFSADTDPDDLFVLPDKATDDSADAVMHREMMGDLLGESAALNAATPSPPAASASASQPLPPGTSAIKPGYVPESESESDQLTSLAVFTAEEERFAFTRAVSRIKEMQADAYMASPHAPKAIPLSGLSSAVIGHLTPTPADSRSFPTTAPGPLPAPLGGVHDPTASPASTTPSTDDFGDEASYRGYLTQYNRYGTGGGRRHTADNDATRSSKPRFAERHIWGLGTWGPRAGEWGEGVRKFFGFGRGGKR